MSYRYHLTSQFVETSMGIGVVNGAYGGTPPSSIPSSIGNAVSQIGILP